MDGGEKLLTVGEGEPGDGPLRVPLEAIRDQLAVYPHRFSNVGLAVQQLADGKIEDRGALEGRKGQVAQRHDQEPHGNNQLAAAAKEASWTLGKVGRLLVWVWDRVLHGTDGAWRATLYLESIVPNRAAVCKVLQFRIDTPFPNR